MNYAVLSATYRTLWRIAAPFAVLRLLWRSRREAGYRAHIEERFGFDLPAPRAGGQLVWIHVVSVGETRAAQPLIDALLAERANLRILITHMTPSGRATGEQLYGDRVQRCYLPYDMPSAVRRFLRHWQPAVGVLIDTEVWPTLIAECRAAEIPLVLANARMSARSARRAARFGSAARTVFGGLTRVLAQSPGDAERLIRLGARDVMVLGNLKFDMALPPGAREQGRAWRAAIGARPVWAAANTRDGEEAEVLRAFELVRASSAVAIKGIARNSGGTALGVPGLAQPPTLADTLLILVPRHPQRFDEVAAQLDAAGLRYVRRSNWDGSALPPEVQVLLGDSMGELSAYYSASDLAFIGGSLMPLGGHNLIEACAVDVPVLIGPHTFNFTQATDDAINAGAARRVDDTESLAQAVVALLTDPARRIAMGEAAGAFAARHRGATARIVRVLLALIGH